MSGARPPRWALASSLAAPVFMIGGWQLAAAVRDDRFDPVRGTISELASRGADHRWIMTLGFVGLGCAHVVTALGTATLRRASRAVLALAGVCVLLVAAFPQPDRGSSTAHAAAATAGFVLLVAWPATTATRGRAWAVRPPVAVAVTLLSAALLAAFAVTLDGRTTGLWERLLAGQQAVWPAVVVLALRRSRRGATIGR
ncbi:DUF998 domain-containing protein [Jatrophihabitans fulvus]